MSSDQLQENQQDKLRVDKWLWAARFFKTRNLASEAIAGGKVHLDGQRVKPSREVRVGTHIRIRKGSVQWEIVVCGLSRQRRPAREAVLLYEETEQSRQRRQEDADRLRQERARLGEVVGRPSKKGRRLIHRFKTLSS